MRASAKPAGSRRNLRNKSAPTAIHISGAEGIYYKKDIPRLAGEYAERALNHTRGAPDRITITIEKLRTSPIHIASLPVATLECSSHKSAKDFIFRFLKRSDISEKAILIAFDILESGYVMRGAALVSAKTGKRLESDKTRGVRVSRLGITGQAAASLSKKLALHGLDNQTVIEAIILASKVASCRDIKAEICVSDNPGYTTGYVSSSDDGYIRIPHIKKSRSRNGGRIFFIEENSDTAPVMDFLEKRAVMINSVSGCSSTRTAYEILGSNNR